MGMLRVIRSVIWSQPITASGYAHIDKGTNFLLVQKPTAIRLMRLKRPQTPQFWGPPRIFKGSDSERPNQTRQAIVVNGRTSA